MSFGSVQTTYSINIPVAMPGMLADLNDYQSVTGVLADPDSTAAFPAGVMVCYLDTPLSDQVQGLDVSSFAPGGTAPPAGIIMHTHATDTIGLQTETTDLVFKQGSVLSLLTKGRIYVTLDASLTIVQGDPVYVRYSANGGNATLGAFSNVTDSGKNTLLRGAYFTTAAAATDTTAVISFDMNAALTAL
jgi:hypothetical protein